MTPATKHLRNLTRIICGSISATGSLGITAEKLRVSETVVKNCLTQANRVGLLSSTYVKRVIENPPAFKKLIRAIISNGRNTLEKTTRSGLVDLSFDQAVKIRQMHSLYQELGTLSLVGQRLGVTRERVRQLLRKGALAGLFSYETTNKRRMKQLQQRLDKQALSSALQQGNIENVARQYGVNHAMIVNLCEIYHLETRELRLHARRQRCLSEYMEAVQQVGSHLSTADLQRLPNGRALYNRINGLWGSFKNFRRAYGITFVPKPNTWSKEHFSPILETLRQQRAERTRHLLSYLEQHPGATVSKTCSDLGIKRPTLYDYIKEQVRLGKIESKRGHGIGQPSHLYLTQLPSQSAHHRTTSSSTVSS